MINKDLIGKTIKKARISNNMTQEELAEYVEISANYLSKIERGLNIPSADIFLKIAEKIGLTMEDFGIYSNKENNSDCAINKIISSYDKKTRLLASDIIKAIITKLE